MSAVTSIHARQIFDSRGNPTVEVDVRSAVRCCREPLRTGIANR
jgi:enolase